MTDPTPSGQQAEVVLAAHEPMEATGGYIECSCGWPTREQWMAGEHYVVHILPLLGSVTYGPVADA